MLTLVLQNIAKQPVSDENVTYVADVLKNVTETQQLETEHIDQVVDVLQEVVMTNDTSEKVSH